MLRVGELIDRMVSGSGARLEIEALELLWRATAAAVGHTEDRSGFRATILKPTHLEKEIVERTEVEELLGRSQSGSPAASSSPGPGVTKVPVDAAVALADCSQESQESFEVERRSPAPATPGRRSLSAALYL